MWDQNSPETRRQWNQWIRDGTRRRWSRPGERSPERDFKKAHSQVPRYSGTTPWRLWKMEFALWLRVYEVNEDEAAKLALLTSMRGAAVQKILPYSCNTADVELVSNVLGIPSAN